MFCQSRDKLNIVFSGKIDAISDKRNIYFPRPLPYPVFID